MLALIPLLPLAGFLVNSLFGKRLPKTISGGVACLAMLASLAISIISVLSVINLSDPWIEKTLFRWIASGDLQIPLQFRLDHLSSLMILVITGIGSLIHIYSTAYMHEEIDSEYARYFSYLNLFAAFMLVLVLGASFPVMFVGWEGVGLCSYLLIGFWFQKPAAADAGKKAFVVNRVGDFGFILGMLLIFVTFNTLDFQEVAAGAAGRAHETLGMGVMTIATLLLFLGAAGKSAQIPLHIWLPDAMEGPTPVSALIHAASMVTAGVFLVCRAHVFFDLSRVGSGLHAGSVVSWIGATTALLAATVAIRQNDIKRVLAYSTLSQLGYMFLAAGVGAYSAALFHMVTHAFFKALLFLGAGSVIHGLHNQQDMRLMGKLKRFMPVTAFTFIIGWLAIAGVPPFAGFWSKDDILAKAWYSGGAQGKALWAVGLVAALLTAFYMTRQVYLVFFSNSRINANADAHDVAHDSGTGVGASEGDGRAHAGEAGVEQREH